MCDKMPRKRTQASSVPNSEPLYCLPSLYFYSWRERPKPSEASVIKMAVPHDVLPHRIENIERRHRCLQGRWLFPPIAATAIHPKCKYNRARPLPVPSVCNTRSALFRSRPSGHADGRFTSLFITKS